MEMESPSAADNVVVQNGDYSPRRKRSLEAEEYHEAKRFLSENFVKMRISQLAPRSQPPGEPTGETSNSVGNTSEEENMDAELDNSDEDSVNRGAGARATAGDSTRSPHPFGRAHSSKIDEALENLIRQSRRKHMLQPEPPEIAQAAGTSSASNTAIILYNSVRSTKDEGEDAAALSPSSTGATGNHEGATSLRKSSSSSRTLMNEPTDGRDTARNTTDSEMSWEDDAPLANVLSPIGSVTVEDVGMEVDSDDLLVEGEGGVHPAELEPMLTRVGTSRGPPTPNITPEIVALARSHRRTLAQEVSHADWFLPDAISG